MQLKIASFYLAQVMPWMHWRATCLILTMFFKVGILPLSIPALGFMLHAMVIIVWPVCKLICDFICSFMTVSPYCEFLLFFLFFLFCIWAVILEMQSFLVHWFRNWEISQICSTCKLWTLYYIVEWIWLLFSRLY